MILLIGEQLLAQQGATRVYGDLRQNGRLSLTNLRIVFEVGGNSPFTAIDVAVDRVFNVHAGRRATLLSGASAGTGGVTYDYELAVPATAAAGVYGGTVTFTASN